MTDKLQYPASPDMEKYLLGCMLCGDARVNCAKIFNQLNADDFFDTANRLLFDIIKKIYDKGQIPNTLSAFEEAKSDFKSGRLSFNYLTGLPAMINTFAYIDLYAEQVKEKSKQRKLMIIGKKLIQGAANGLNTDHLQAQFAQDLSDITAQNKRNTFDSREDCLTASLIDVIGEKKKYRDRTTGFANIDAHHQTFEPGVYVIGAVPAAGKTTFCWQFAEQLALKGETVLYFTYEIEWFKLWTKSLARRFRSLPNPPSVNQIINADVKSDLVKAAFDVGMRFEDELDQAKGALVIIEADDNYSADKIINTARSYCKPGQKAPIVFVDYLQKVAHDKEIARDGIDKTMRAFKYFQRQSDVTFVVITSYNRMNYRQQVALESSKESGGIEYEADVVWGMQLNVMNSIKGGESESSIREKADKAMKQTPREIHLKCMKNRNGECYDAFFNYYSVSAHFEPVDGFDESSPPETTKPVTTEPIEPDNVKQSDAAVAQSTNFTEEHNLSPAHFTAANEPPDNNPPLKGDRYGYQIT